MGLLDDLQMGFGLKERTEDYDARTARTIASNAAEQAARSRGAGDHAAMIAGIRARQSYDPSQPTGQSEYYLNRAGGTGYRPAITQDDRPFMQRLLFSPESDASPRPYAIGPLTMDQPLPKFGLLGLLSGLGGMFGRDAQEMGPPQTTVRPMLRPEGLSVTPDVVPATNVGMDRFESDDARNIRASLASGMPTVPLSVLAMQGPNQPASYVSGQSTKSTAAYPLGLAEKYSEAALSQMAPEMIDYLSRIEAEEQGLTPITTGPHAGKYMDAGGRLVMP